MTIKTSMQRDEELPDVPMRAFRQPEESKPPVVHYARASDELKVYWYIEETKTEAIDEDERFTLLRSSKQHDLVCGAKIRGLSELLPGLGATTIPPLDRSKDEDVARFMPYAGYDNEHDALVIRWYAGKSVNKPIFGPRPIALLVDAVNTGLIIGMVIPEISAIARKHPGK